MKFLAIASILVVSGAPVAAGYEHSGRHGDASAREQVYVSPGEAAADGSPVSTVSADVLHPIATRWNCTVDQKGRLRDCTLRTPVAAVRNFQAAGKRVLRRCTLSAVSMADVQRHDNNIAFGMTFFSSTNLNADALGPGIAGVSVDIRPKPSCAFEPEYFGPSPPPPLGYNG